MPPDTSGIDWAFSHGSSKSDYATRPLTPSIGALAVRLFDEAGHATPRALARHTGEVLEAA